ncbi:MAG: hypothetical protein HN561_08785 [Candidatus Scalindua sp.]|jgi:hypothetical protein|nr:hypothetical protein [Candidatus Scalindua sp.]
MIDSQIFRTSREAARCKIPVEVARNSFGYYIDIPNGWETYRSPEELIGFLGIHNTHAARFLEIIEDLGPLTEEEHDWVRRYVSFYSGVARLLSSTGTRVDLKGDVAETLFDWRTILKFTELPCRVLDYGAGCARQGTSAFLRNKDNIYTAVDSTLAGYTVQNLVLSYIDTFGTESTFVDFLDLEMAGKPFPEISKAKPGSRFHVPAWLAEANIPEKFFDVIICAHVHNELSGPDFLRYIWAVEKGLAPNGIAYVRSELTAQDTRDYFDTVDLHGLDIVSIFREKDIVPIYSKYESAYLTTVFARKGSSHYKHAIKSKAVEHSFTDIKTGPDISHHAGGHSIERNLQLISSAKKKTALVCNGTDAAKTFLKIALIGKGVDFFNRFLKPVISLIRNKGIYSEEDFLGDKKDETGKKLSAFDPDVIVIASQQLFAIEEEIKKMLPDREFPLRRHYWYPVLFLYKESVNGADKIFDKPIFGPEDLPSVS